MRTIKIDPRDILDVDFDSGRAKYFVGISGQDGLWPYSIDTYGQLEKTLGGYQFHLRDILGNTRTLSLLDFVDPNIGMYLVSEE